MDNIAEFHRLESSQLKCGAQARTTNRSKRVTFTGGGAEHKFWRVARVARGARCILAHVWLQAPVLGRLTATVEHWRVSPCVKLGGSVQFSLVVTSCLQPHWTAASQAFLSITNSKSSLKLMSIESVMPSTISSSVVPFSSCLQSFPASGSFQMSQFFASGGQSIGVSASASVLPMNIQD